MVSYLKIKCTSSFSAGSVGPLLPDDRQNVAPEGLRASRCLGQMQMSRSWLITSVVVRRRFYHAAAALALRFLD
jgi:hypothetical protein